MKSYSHKYLFLYFPPVSCFTKQKCPTAVIFQCKHRKSAEVPWHRNIKLFSYRIIFLSNILAAFFQLGKCVLGTFHISLQPIPENRNYHYCPFSWHPKRRGADSCKPREPDSPWNCIPRPIYQEKRATTAPVLKNNFPAVFFFFSNSFAMSLVKSIG